MHLLADTGRRLRQRLLSGGPGSAPGRKKLALVLVGVIAVLGVVAAAVLVSLGGKPTPGTSAAARSREPASAPAGTASAGTTPAGTAPAGTTTPASTTAPAAKSSPVVPVLGGKAEGQGKQIPVSARAVSETKAAATVAPLSGLRQADLLVVAPFTLSAQVLEAVSRQPGVTSADPLEAAKIKINGMFTAVLGVNPSTFRGYAAKSTAASNPLWQGVADGGVAVSYTMGTLDKLSLGGQVIALGRTQERLPVVAFGTVGIGGVDAVVSDTTAKSLGMPAANAIVISAPPASLVSLAAKIKQVLPKGAGIEPLETQVTSTSAGASPSATVSAGAGSAGAGSAGTAIAGATAGSMTAAELTTALRAAEGARGKPYVWGAAGPSSFDCSGLVQWSFAQAGVTMPRVAADQARTGPAVPVSQLEPGDLLFYHTDPTDPGYISHVAIYLGNGWMIQAPEPGMDVQIVPASFGSEFAGAIRVAPKLASAVASGLV